MKNKIAIVVLSFDGFKELWQPFFDFFFQSWPNCHHNIYLLNNHIKFNDERVINLLVGDDLSWSDSLIKGLNKIPEEKVFFLYDDAFIYKIDLQKLNYHFNNSIKKNYLSLHLRPSYFVSKFGIDKPTLIPQRALYRNALFCNLISRKHLLKLLDNSESAWDFEMKGNIRSIPYKYFSIKKSFIKYHHGIVKARWVPSVYVKLTKKNYSFKKLNDVMSINEEIKLKIKTFVHNFYMYLIPLKFVLIIENKRKGNIYKNE